MSWIRSMVLGWQIVLVTEVPAWHRGDDDEASISSSLEGLVEFLAFGSAESLAGSLFVEHQLVANSINGYLDAQLPFEEPGKGLQPPMEFVQGDVPGGRPVVQ